MFPIPFNFPFRKANGDISTIGAEINAGGGGSTYTLPTASADVKGGVKIGEGLTMEGEVLKNTNPTPATPYTLPTASDEVLGGVKVGSNLSIDENGVLSASGGGGGSAEFTKVWTNPNVLNNFPASGLETTIEISGISNYKEFMIRFYDNGNYYPVIFSLPETNDVYPALFPAPLDNWSSTTSKLYIRRITKVATGLKFGWAYYNNMNESSGGDSSSVYKPYEIYAR